MLACLMAEDWEPSSEDAHVLNTQITLGTALPDGSLDMLGI